MKLYKKVALALCVILATSCTLDLREDPNAVQPSQILPSLLLNSIQRNLAGMFNGASGTGASLTRQLNGGSSLYRTTITPEGFNGVWSTAYASILSDADQLMKIAVPDKTDPNTRYARHMGIARIVQAYTLLLMVDMFGDVPFSTAFKGDANFNPSVDQQSALYAKAITLLDSAKLDLTTPTTTSSPPGYQSPIAPDLFDMYYGNGPSTPTTVFTKWVKLANSLKLKAYLNQRVDAATKAAAETAIAAMVADVTPTGGFMSTADESFIFRYGTTTADPDARHPAFVAQYPAGGGAYQANWFMWHMFHGYDATQRNTEPGDPRMRFYFYRQVQANSTSTNEIRCLGESVPSHYPGSTGTAIIDNSSAGRPPMGVGANHPTNDPADPAWNRTFCYSSDRGYWGRDHIDPQGIPPDGLLRTAYGPYPVGGRFDANTGNSPTSGGVTQTSGMRGAGMQPLMMRSYVQFMLAEAALYMTIGGLTPLQYYTNGINYSFTDVRAFSVAGTLGTTTVAAAATEAAINTFYQLNFAGTFAALGAVKAATTGNIALTGTPIIDGYQTIAGDRVLVKNQTTANQNGIYDVAAGAWTRSTDADLNTEVLNQAVTVTPLPFPATNTNGNTRWLMSTTGTIVLGTTALAYAANYSYTNDVTNYVASATAAFSTSLGLSADAAMNYVAREYWVAAFGNGVEAYNLYRRTGMPTGMQPTITPAPGTFPRIYWYPANFALLNNTVDQRADLTGRVFWDTGSAILDF
jgi:hypothetical protein